VGHPDTLGLTNSGSELIELLNVMLDAFAGIDCGGIVDQPRLFVPVIVTGLEGAPLAQNGIPLGQDGLDPVVKTTLFRKFETTGSLPEPTRSPLS
jgi:hypothetical protein